jgi:hypothetical protein
MLMESMGYKHLYNCHGRGRGFEPRRPRHPTSAIALAVKGEVTEKLALQGTYLWRCGSSSMGTRWILRCILKSRFRMVTYGRQKKGIMDEQLR